MVGEDDVCEVCSTKGVVCLSNMVDERAPQSLKQQQKLIGPKFSRHLVYKVYKAQQVVYKYI